MPVHAPASSCAKTHNGPSLDELELRVRKLQEHRVFDETVRAEAQALLDSLPPVEGERDTTRKARLLLLRCETRLLFPCVSKEAEADCHAVLKLKQDSAPIWVILSECLLRRNAFKDACDALESALRVNPKNCVALCKYSQVQRNRCSEAGLSAAQKHTYMLDSVAKARAAVAANVDSGNAWYTLALALLSLTAREGMSMTGVRKALAAIQQAEKKEPDDPDVQFNKAMIESLLGHFADASRSFVRAHELDPHRLKGTLRLAEDNKNIIARTLNRIKGTTGIGKREYKKLCATVAAARSKGTAAGTASAATRCAVIVDLVNTSVMQPHVLLVTDDDGTFSHVLLYEVNSSYFKIGDVLTWPASEPCVNVEHVVPAMSVLEQEAALTLSIPQHYVAMKELQINGKSLPSSARVPLQMSSRLFM